MKCAVVLAGGGGTRFWPVSRKKKPKQLLKLVTDKALLEDTVDRVSPVVDRVAISTGKHLEQPIKELLPETELIVEPMPRDTAAAIGLCLTRFNDDDYVGFFPSDPFINTSEQFQSDLAQAFEQAKGGDIVLIGVPPTYPATVLGYIEPGDNQAVKSFREKPELKTAEQYVKDGYLWNAGIFVAKVGTLMDAFKEYAPDIHSTLQQIRDGGDVDELFPTIRKTSIDYAIMEQAKNISYVPASFTWSDIGTFDALPEVHPGENSVIGAELYAKDSKGNVVYTAEGKAVALIDCEDLCVVDTPDALLVVPKTSVAKIKELLPDIPDELK